MANYTVDANWTAKDSAATGSADKVIRGVEFQTEFDLIASAIATKFDSTTAVDIDSGSIDNTTIGAATPASGTFTNLTATATVTLASPILNTAVSGTAVLDEDDMASDSATKLATQQSIKAYVDAETANTWNASADRNYYFGTLSFANNSTGDDNIAVGYRTLNATTAGSSNIAIGSYTLQYATSDFNTGVGARSLYSVTSGGNNTALGHGAAYAVTTASSNIAIGRNSLAITDTSSNNVAIGYEAMSNFDGGLSGNNVAVGYQAMQYSTSELNVAVGYKALQGDSFTPSSGNGNIGIGYFAGGSLTTGSGNTIVGFTAGFSATTATNCTYIGHNAGDGSLTGSNVTCLGNESDPSSNSANNEITLGNSSVTSLRCNVTSITSLSDIRDKTNIADLTGCSAFVKELEPVSFDWSRRDGSMQGEVGHGFIAQQLKAAQETTGHHIPGLVSESNPEKLEAAYGAMLPTVIAALKEALVEIDELKAKVAALESA